MSSQFYIYIYILSLETRFSKGGIVTALAVEVFTEMRYGRTRFKEWWTLVEEEHSGKRVAVREGRAM